MESLGQLLRDLYADMGFVGLFAVMGWLFGVAMTVGIGYVALRRFTAYDERLAAITRSYDEIASNIHEQTESLRASSDKFDDHFQVVVSDAIRMNERVIDKLTTLQQVLIVLIGRINGRD
jgi:hypothetical protein